MTDTSRFAYEKIMNPGARESIWKKIILCLEWIHEGTNYEIAAWMKVKPEKVWKRTGKSELSCPVHGAIFDTGKRRSSPDGNPCIVYALSSCKSEYDNVLKPEKHYMEGVTTAGDYASMLVAGTKQAKLVQKELFETI